MKKQAIHILATPSLLVMLAVTSAFAGSSTRIETEMPFEFTVGSKTSPAGTYTVTEEMHGVLRIRSLDHRTSVAVFGRSIQGKSRQGSAVLVVNRYGDRHFLTEAWLGLAGGYDLEKSRQERELASRRPKAEPEVISIVSR